MEASVKSVIYIASFVLPFVALIATALWLRQVAKPAEIQSDPACIGLYDDAAALQGLVPIDDARSESIDRMLAVRGRCLADPYFLDTLSSVMIDAGRATGLRNVLASPESTAVLPQDVIRLHIARAQVAEANQQAHAGAGEQAAALRNEAIATAESLMQRWPRWQEAYMLADLAEGGGAQRFEQQFQARGAAFDPGTWIARNAAVSWLIAIATVFAGLAALGMAYRGWTGARQLDTPISQIALASPGFVALRGSVHVPAGLTAKAHPDSGTPCVWYRVTRSKGNTLRSPQAAMLRDGSGTLLLDLEQATVSPGAIDPIAPPRVIGRMAEGLLGQGQATEAAQALDRMLAARQPRNHLVEGDMVTVYGALAGERNEKRGMKRHDRPVLVLGGPVEEKRAEMRSAQRWGLLLGVPLLAFCAWIVREMTRTGFTPWG